MKGILLKTGFVFGLVLMLLLTNITQGHLGCSSGSIQQKNADALFIPTTEKNSVFSLNVFGKSNLEKQDVGLSVDDALLIFNQLKELTTQMTEHPFTEKTQNLKTEFVDLLVEKGLIPNEVSKESYLSLLSPRWVKQLQNTENKTLFPQPFAHRGTCALCSIGGGGSGTLIPLFLLPRPRVAMAWLGTGVTTATNLLTTRGYIAEGAQTGFTLGFMGIGITYAVPGYMLYGFIGYALLASTTGEYVEYYPPNRAPEISDIQPLDGEQNAPVSLSELQFRIQDPDGDLMSYTVTTDPDIGSSSGNLKPFGVYKVPISGLQVDKIYKWTVKVTDGKETKTETNSFITEGKPPFDPFTQGWHYRKKITIDHTKVAGELTNFPILLSVIDQDLREKAQNDGDDILFMDNVGVATKLPHQIEYFDSSTGTLIAWVNVPIVHSTEDTSLYMYYGNASSTNQQFPEKVWITHYSAVWHLNNNPLGSIFDSSSKDNDGTAQGGMTSSDLVNGKIGFCLDFDGIDDYISVPDFTNSMNVGTCIAWIQTTTTEIGAVWGEARTTSDKPYIVCGKYYNDALWFARDIYGVDSNYQGFKPIGINDGQWHHVAWLSKGSGNGNTFYFDGQPVSLNWQDGQNPNGIWFDDQSTDTNSIGALDRPSSRSHWAGLLDEIRIANIPLSAAWITTEYTNQINPASFLYFGLEIQGP
jgi:hypothetical protein